MVYREYTWYIWGVLHPVKYGDIIFAILLFSITETVRILTSQYPETPEMTCQGFILRRVSELLSNNVCKRGQQFCLYWSATFTLAVVS